MLAYHRYVSHADSDRVRIVGEPVWSTLSAAAVTEWTRYESLLNVELALAPAAILCPYDAAAPSRSSLGRLMRQPQAKA